MACNYTVHACFICVCVLFSWLVNITRNTSSVLFHSILTYLLTERWMSFSPFSWIRLYLTWSVVRGWCFLRIFLKPYMFDPRANDYTILHLSSYCFSYALESSETPVPFARLAVWESLLLVRVSSCYIHTYLSSNSWCCAIVASNVCMWYLLLV